MSTHRFILEPYKGISTRYTCPNCHRQRCFSKYIDTEKQIWFPDYVGRCDHEQKCGYHFTPRDYFEQNPSEKEKFAENSFGSYTPIKEVKTGSHLLHGFGYSQPIITRLFCEQVISVSIGSIRRGGNIESYEEIQGWYFQVLGRCNRILANGQSE